ncbi:putative ELL-associated factor [Quillaja saponaria]|uniref:ELL-associated factor n=1 Tax=Quillaja saponaria TaxID=32244 RepID=A0AAD7P5H8_QUISA|nr:putative ELL-associated factor [Quillaja saponaria]
MANNSREEPKTAPHSDRWYNLTLGPSFKEESSSKYCTLRYEFKPASIDKTKRGSLRKTKENRVSVEFQNNQLGKPKVTFEGSSEEYKENDAVLFFDGDSFRLERLHKAVKQLRHLRLPGESAAAAAVAVSSASAAPSGPALETRSSPIGKTAKSVQLGRSTIPPVPVEVEHIDIGEPENPGAKSVGKQTPDHSTDPPNVSTASPATKSEDVEEHRDIDINDLFGSGSPEDDHIAEENDNGGFDINVPRHNDSDDEIADVDDSGDEVDKGPNAAEALRAQVNAEGRNEQTSSSSSSSGSESSGSGSGSGSSSSSDSDGSDEDSVNSI